jgi:hypothetical protein
LDNVEQITAARPQGEMPQPSPGQQLDGPEMLVQHVRGTLSAQWLFLSLPYLVHVGSLDCFGVRGVMKL